MRMNRRDLLKYAAAVPAAVLASCDKKKATEKGGDKKTAGDDGDKKCGAGDTTPKKKPGTCLLCCKCGQVKG